jgi:N-ethylmaleimide reductase
VTLPHLLSPYARDGVRLAHRVAMAPMTRNRAKGTVPGPLTATYYAQRASAAILVTEGTQPDAAGQGYLDTPGLHDDGQQAGWAQVVRAVRAAGDARLHIQLMHCGRVAHPAFTGGATPVAPSAVPAAGQAFTPEGPADHVVPRALATAELATVRDAFVAAARRAVAAGADGVELHAANGYLLHQFLAAGTNRRTDGYGGDVAGRIRFVVEVAEAVAVAIGAGRVGLRLSPGHPFNDMDEPDARATYDALLRRLAGARLGYLHVIETRSHAGFSSVEQARRRFQGMLVVNAGFGEEFDLAGGDRLVADGQADVVAFGRRFLANPDLPRRLREGAAFNPADRATFYGGDERGYTDYPSLGAAAATRSP